MYDRGSIRESKHVDYVLIWHEDESRITTCARRWLRDHNRSERQRAGNREDMACTHRNVSKGSK